MAEPMNEALRVVCFKNAEEIAAYVREDPKRINLLVARGKPARLEAQRHRALAGAEHRPGPVDGRAEGQALPPPGNRNRIT